MGVSQFGAHAQAERVWLGSPLPFACERKGLGMESNSSALVLLSDEMSPYGFAFSSKLAGSNLSSGIGASNAISSSPDFSHSLPRRNCLSA